MTATRELVLQTLHPSVLIDRSALTLPLPKQDQDWDKALNLAERLHAASPFASVLLRTSSRLEPYARDLLEERLRRERLLQAVLDTEMEFALELLSADRIPVIVLKGMDLGRRFYPERLLRPMADADLLVPEEAFTQALSLLERHGFRRVGELTPGRFRIELSRPESGGAVVELHCKLQRGETSERSRRIWDTAREGMIPGLPRSAWALDPTVLVPYLIRHAAVQHLIESPVWLNDLHLVLGSPEFLHEKRWDIATDHLIDQQTCAAGWFVLTLLASNWGTRVPDRVLRTLEQKAGRIRPALLASRRRSWFREQDRTLASVVYSRLLLRDSVLEALSYGITRERPPQSEKNS